MQIIKTKLPKIMIGETVEIDGEILFAEKKPGPGLCRGCIYAMTPCAGDGEFFNCDDIILVDKGKKCKS